MKELNQAIKNTRQRHPKPKDPKRYITFWTEKEVLNEKVVDAFVMILRTRGCEWAQSSGCTMCGYINDTTQKEIKEEDILHQFSEVMKNHSGEPFVKIYTSGSFLDENELPRSAQDEILENLGEKTQRILFESRPKFVTKERLKDQKNLEIAFGLESANDFVLENSINKGFGVNDYLKAAKTAKDLDIGVRTYLLIKPPFLSEKEAITDSVNSAKTITEYTDCISFNPVNIQNFTLVERLWKNREYRPPWLWSVVAVLKECSELKGVRFLSSPTAGGTKKGAHNCGICDPEVLGGIAEFSLSQDISYLDRLDCECKDQWQDILSTEHAAKTQGDLFKLV